MRSRPDAEALAADARGGIRFAARLYHTLAEQSSEGLLVSPESARLALAMVYAGARGETARELRDTLGLTPQSHTIAGWLASSWAALAVEPKEEWRKSEAVILRSANRLFVQKNAPLVPEFLELTARDYGAPADPVDFKTQTELARASINRWVDEHTQHKIREILGPRTLSADTRLLLANAIYLRASWTEPFEKSATRAARFDAPSGSRQVPTRPAPKPRQPPSPAPMAEGRRRAP